MRTGRVDNYWTLADNPRLLPRETRDYVPMILAAIVIAKNPVQYGFDLLPTDLHTYDTVILPRPADLRLIAEWADTSIDVIQSLNPELRRWTTPIRDAAYTLKVPVGTADVVRARLDDTSTRDLASLRWYTVKPGDTLATIARSLRVNRTDLAAANYLEPTSRVNPGSKLMVPHESTVLMAARADRPIPATESRSMVANAVVPAVSTTTGDRIKVTYQVRPGDTLGSIARVFNTSVNLIQSWNRLPDTKLHIGDRLTIYTPQRH